MATNIITIALSVFLIISLLFKERVYNIVDKIWESRAGSVLVVITIIAISALLIVQA